MRILRTSDANPESASSASPDAAATAEGNQSPETSSGQSADSPNEGPKSAWEFVQQQLGEKHEGLVSEPKETAEPEESHEEPLQDLEKSHEDKPDKSKEKEAKQEPPQSPTEQHDDKGEKPPPFHKHPAWQRREQEIRTLREQQTKMQERLTGLDQFEQYRVKNQINDEQLAEALQLLALANSNPAQAIEKLQAITDRLSKVAGTKLPEDLATKVQEIEALVEEKVLDQETGKSIIENIKETARLRAEKQFGTERGKQTAAQRAAETQRAIVQDLNAWDENKAKTDPDFGMKKELVMTKYIELMQLEGKPQDSKQAITMAEKALAWVDAQAGKFRPKPRARRVVTSNGSSTTTSRERPKTALGAVAQMLREKHNIDLDGGSDEE